MIRTEKKKEESKRYHGLSILFNSSIPEIKIMSIHRDWKSLNYTKSTQVLLSQTIFFVLFCRLLYVFFLQRGMAEQQSEDFAVFWLGHPGQVELIQGETVP